VSANRFEPVRLGVVGLGSFGRLHALTAAGLAEAELVALVARRQASVDEMHRELPDVPGWIDLERAMAESDAEAWIVASSTASHVPLATSLLQAGYPLLMEKPLASTLADAERLAPLLADHPERLMMGHILLFNSEFRQLQAEVAQRGPLWHIDCVRHRPVETRRLFPGESPFHLTMVHDLYSVLALVEGREPVAFSAQVHRADDGSPDLTLAQLRWEDGLLASFAASFMTPEGLPADGFDRLELFAEGWAARLQANPRPLTLWDAKARSPLTLEISADPRHPSGMLAEELRAFCRLVRGQSTIPLGARYQDALQVQRWLDRLESAAEG